MSIDHWNHLKAAGDVPPPSPEVQAHAKRQLAAAARRRTIKCRVMVPVLATAGATAAVIGAVAVYLTSAGPIPVTGPSVLPSQAVPSATPANPSGKPGQGVAASCVSTYTPAELRNRAFAFDGTVLTIARDPAGPTPSYLVTLQVNEWFKPTDGALRVAVRTYNPPVGSREQVSTDFPDYSLGSRLLITGEPQWGGSNPLKDAFAWGCGFSRAYGADDAATWRKILNK